MCRGSWLAEADWTTSVLFTLKHLCCTRWRFSSGFLQETWLRSDIYRGNVKSWLSCIRTALFYTLLSLSSYFCSQLLSAGLLSLASVFHVPLISSSLFFVFSTKKHGFLVRENQTKQASSQVLIFYSLWDWRAQLEANRRKEMLYSRLFQISEVWGKCKILIACCRSALMPPNAALFITSTFSIILFLFQPLY